MIPKIHVTWFVRALMLATPLYSQEESADMPRVVGSISTGERSAPVEKPPLPGTDVEQSVVHREGGRSIIMQRVAPPALPDPPPAPQPRAPLSDEQRAVLVQKAGETRSRVKNLLLSATVYDRQKTLLRWWHEGQEYTAWSNVDFNYLCGFGSFEVGGIRWSLMLCVGNMSTANYARIAQERGKIYTPPISPKLSADDPSFVIVQGDATKPEASAPINALHQLYKSTEKTLKAAYEKRTRNAAEQLAYDKAHPRQPEDVTIQFWKRKTPPKTQSAAEGGAR